MGPRLASRGNRRLDAWGRRGAGFNGAAAREPRKQLRLVPASASQRASMGPRLASRGNLLFFIAGTDHKMLQWGRGSRAAETKENEIMGKLAEASMGPRLASRGNACGAGLCDGQASASMGPRLASRGNGLTALKTLDLCGLQWGRGSRAAETARRRSRRRRASGFNGAAAREPRKRIEVAALLLPESLQWGRGSRAAETLFSHPNTGAVDRLQWGRGSRAAETYGAAPRPGTCPRLQWGRGSRAAETPRATDSAIRSRRFNGAAAREPRKPLSARRARRRYAASMGPRLASRGNMIALLETIANNSASMGPRLASRGNELELAPEQRAELLQWGRGSRAAETQRP